MRALAARHDVGREQACVVEPAQRAVDRRVADLLQSGRAQPAHHLVAVAVCAVDHRQHGEVEHSLEQLARFHDTSLHVSHDRMRQGWRATCQARVRITHDGVPVCRSWGVLPRTLHPRAPRCSHVIAVFAIRGRPAVRLPGYPHIEIVGAYARAGTVAEQA